MENGVHKNDRSERRSRIVNECMNGVHFHTVNEDVNGVQKFGERFKWTKFPFIWAKASKSPYGQCKKKLNISWHYRKRLKLPKNSTLFTFKIAKRTQKWTILGNRERPWERSFMLKSGTRTRTSSRFLKENGNGNAVHYFRELPYLCLKPSNNADFYLGIFLA